MWIDPETGLLDAAPYSSSPNRDLRPDPAEITLLVVHGISLPPGEFGGDWIERLFTNRLDPATHPAFESLAGLRVSAHLLIRRDGELQQFVPFHERAWHAGRSCWQGRTGCNDFSVGVELEGTDETPYTGAQYQRLAGVVEALASAYPRFDGRSVVGHSDIAPERKTDPGPAFDWWRLDAMAGANGSIARGVQA